MGMERPDPLAEPEGYGQRRTGNAAAPDYGGETCSVQVRGGALCGKPSVRIMTFGDEQEHIVTLGFCLGHQSDAAGRRPYCTTCESHLGRRVWMQVLKIDVSRVPHEAMPEQVAQRALDGYFKDTTDNDEERS